MAPSVMTAFAMFLRDHHYSTRMWESGFEKTDANTVCRELSVWAQSTLGVSGDFVVLWTDNHAEAFSGDAELCYVSSTGAFLIANPFIEGEAEGFVSALTQIVNGREHELFPVTIKRRVLYNAV